MKRSSNSKPQLRNLLSPTLHLGTHRSYREKGYSWEQIQWRRGGVCSSED
ncbi:hypothetical protein Gotri_024575 [Gossypium trilobum]|uniref:Uncharacterized protein n=1 Tax=Gossypium trilobum TaxID=34281 RepID=A0A7J9DNL3_9ROSI|nr:hypothetical protein [Gossypium trilobum]